MWRIIRQIKKFNCYLLVTPKAKEAFLLTSFLTLLQTYHPSHDQNYNRSYLCDRSKQRHQGRYSLEYNHLSSQQQASQIIRLASSGNDDIVNEST